MKKGTVASSESASQEFGRLLKSWREAAGFRSQRAAVIAVRRRKGSLSQGLLAHYESGRVQDPSAELLARLASIYRVDFLEVMLRLARAKYRSVQGDEGPVERARWELLESGVALLGPVGTTSGFEVDRLRARAAVLREVEILDSEGIAKWQRSIEGLESFWVVAPYFLDDEEEHVVQAVVENLRRGVRYTYFTYPDVKARFDALLASLQARAGSRVKVAHLASAVWLPPGATTWLHSDYLVANPTQRGRATGFQNLRSGGKTRFAFSLPTADLLALVDKVSAWMATDRKAP